MSYERGEREGAEAGSGSEEKQDDDDAETARTCALADREIYMYTYVERGRVSMRAGRQATTADQLFSARAAREGSRYR